MVTDEDRLRENERLRNHERLLEEERLWYAGEDQRLIDTADAQRFDLLIHETSGTDSGRIFYVVDAVTGRLDLQTSDAGRIEQWLGQSDIAWLRQRMTQPVDVREHLEVHDNADFTGVLRQGATVHPGASLTVTGVLRGITTVHAGARLILKGIAEDRVVLEPRSLMDIRGALQAEVVDNGGQCIIRVGAIALSRQVGPHGRFVPGSHQTIDENTPAFELLDGQRIGRPVRVSWPPASPAP